LLYRSNVTTDAVDHDDSIPLLIAADKRIVRCRTDALSSQHQARRSLHGSPVVQELRRDPTQLHGLQKTLT